jgi:Xaa-Pro aminopeptidase
LEDLVAVQCIESLDGSTGFVRLTSDEERARRFSDLRRAMQQEGHAALVVCGRSDLRFRGRVLYVSDVFQFTADCFVVLGMAGRPVFISTPIVGLGQAQLTSWAREFRSNAAPGEEIGKVLIELGLDASDIGIVGLSDAIAAEHLRQIATVVPNAQLRDATRLFERARQIKSPEEIENMRGTSAIFRKIFAALEAEIRPGTSEADIAGCASRVAKLHGCRDVKTAMATTPFRAISYGSRKRIEKDDQVMVWIETPGPTGYWLELRRCYSFGAPPARVQRFWNLIEECWDVGLRAIRPGVLASEVMAKIGAVIRKAGYDLSDASYSLHGIGADAIEGMWIPGNDRVLEENEVVSLHPSITFADEEEAQQLRFIGTTDNVLVTAGGGERLTYPADRIINL